MQSGSTRTVTRHFLGKTTAAEAVKNLILAHR